MLNDNHMGENKMVKPIRRIVAGNDDNGKAVVLSDGPSKDVKIDPARPGFASTRLWVTDATPARVAGIRDTLDLPHSLEPPIGGTACRFVEFPPDKNWIGSVRPADVSAWFAAMDSSGAHVSGPHPYMQRTQSLDLCYILEGEIALVLDTGEVPLGAGTAVVLNGARHAWANHSDRPALVIMSQHSGVDEIAPPPPNAEVRPGAATSPPEKVTGLIRRVVAAQDAQGRSRVIADGPVPNAFPRPSGSWFYELWTLDEGPARLLGEVDAGRKGRTVMHSPPPVGANWRISYNESITPPAKVASIDDKTAKAMDTGGGTERREGGKIAGMHRTPSLDYAICLEGDRVLLLEDSEVVLNKGDVVIQCGNWHSWGPKSDMPTIMSYVMIGGEFG